MITAVPITGLAFCNLLYLKAKCFWVYQTTHIVSHNINLNYCHSTYSHITNDNVPATADSFLDFVHEKKHLFVFP
jgi:hypothetical protein